MVRPWQLPDHGPRGAGERFVAAVAALLDAHEEAQEEARRASLDPGRREAARGARRRVAELAAEAEGLEGLAQRGLQRALQGAAGCAGGEGADDSGPWRCIAVARPLPPSSLLQLSHAGCLDEQLRLRRDVGGLRAGWRLLPGGALACADLGSGAAREALPALLAQLARRGRPAALAFATPLLDLLGEQLVELRGCRAEAELEAERAREAARQRARAALQESEERELARLAARGLDLAGRAGRPAAELRPAHLERRVPWDEYRDAARLQRTRGRRAARAQARHAGRCARLASEELPPEHELPRDPADGPAERAVDPAGAPGAGATAPGPPGTAAGAGPPQAPPRDPALGPVPKPLGQALSEAAAADIARRLRRL